MQIGPRIKEMRSQRGFTQTELAEKSGMSRSYLADIEADRYNPSIKTLEKIAKALVVPVDLFLRGGSGKYHIGRVYDLCFKQGLTLEQLGELLGVPASSIKSIQYGAIPSDDSLEKISRYFECTVRDLLASNISRDTANEVKEDPKPYNVSELAKQLSNEKPNNVEVPNDSMALIPVLGTIKAGYDLLASQQIIDYKYVPKSYVNDGEYFYLRVTGDSMVDAGIREGYRVLVRRQNFVENGKIGVILINGDEATLKKVYYQNDMIMLVAANSKIEPRLIKTSEVLIQGQVTKVEFDV